MSLLLDALKKAAEQKAAKTRDEEPRSGASSPDETVLDASTAEAQEGSTEDDSIPRHQLEDETELDHSELQTRLESLQGEREDRTEIGFDATETRSTSPGQAGPGEDETVIVDKDDAATALGQADSGEEQTVIVDEDDATEALAQARSGEDQTLVFDADDATQFVEDQTGATRPTFEDETELHQPLQPQDRTETARGDDQTDTSMPTARVDGLEAGEAHSREAKNEDTESSASTRVEEPTYHQDDTGPSDDDMSLLLVEREPTQFTSHTSTTDPQRPQDALQALRGEAPTAADLGLVDSTQNSLGEDRTSTTDTTQNRTRSSDTATTGLIAPNRVRPAPPPDDATGTQTYAPDNYDRTLMRLPNDDASKLFAGMKSDSDVVMTPDYAKQVFRSKSSAQRVQHYKFYSGIAIVILLAIGVYGAYEYQAENEIIDSNLRPLKNDPMPGIIRPEGAKPESNPLLVGGEVNERALEIIKSVEQDESMSAEPELAEEEVSAARAESEEPLASEAGEPETAASETASAQTARQAEPEAAGTGSAEAGEPADSQTSISGVIAETGEPPSGAGASSKLKIQTASRVQEKQLLLREAYQAYQSGNDQLALQSYNRVLQIDPVNRNALLARAAIEFQNGNSKAAIEDYRALLLANPKDSLAMASLIAVAKYSPQETETQLKLMIRDEPDSPYLNFALANAYGAQNRWQEAQGYYYKALQNNPDDPNYAYNLAVSLEHISQPSAAVSYYRRALENYNKGLATFNRDVVDRRLEKLAKP